MYNFQPGIMISVQGGRLRSEGGRIVPVGSGEVIEADLVIGGLVFNQPSFIKNGDVEYVKAMVTHESSRALIELTAGLDDEERRLLSGAHKIVFIDSSGQGKISMAGLSGPSFKETANGRCLFQAAARSVVISLV